MKCRSIFFYYWFPVLIYCFIIYLISSVSSLPVGPKIANIDKLYHSIEYFILTILLWRAFVNTQHPLCVRYAKWCALSASILYGFIDEIHQYFVPKRFSSIWDVLFDSIGTAFAILVIVIFLRIYNKKEVETVAVNNNCEYINQ